MQSTEKDNAKIINAMISLVRTHSENPDYRKLVLLLDADLRIRDGEEHAFYAQFNKSDAIKHVVLAYENDNAVGCGAVKQYDAATMEVKRMFVAENQRGKGIASKVLSELERWSEELGFQHLILETGNKQHEAIGLYSKRDYNVIPNYGQYEGVENSVCFEKYL